MEHFAIACSLGNNSIGSLRKELESLYYYYYVFSIFIYLFIIIARFINISCFFTRWSVLYRVIDSLKARPYGSLVQVW